MLKVLHLLSSDRFSGAENVVITMINAFRKYDPQQYKFVYVSLEGSIRERLKQEHIKYEAIEKVSRREIQRVIHKYHPSIIHAHDFTASIICASVAGKIPVISHIHNNSPWLRKVCINSIGYGVSCFKYKYMSLKIRACRRYRKTHIHKQRSAESDSARPDLINGF